MVKIKYKALFSVEFPHPFYASGKSPDVEMTPSVKCESLMKSLGLRFLPTNFGGKLFAKVNSVASKDIIQSPLPEGSKFTFLLKLKNSVFENISNINLIRPANNRFYFNNLVNNLSAGNAPLLVSNTTSKVVSDSDLLPFVQGSLAVSENSTAPIQSGEIDFIDSGEKLQQAVSNSNNTFNHSFDLNKTSGGRFRFSIDGIEKGKFFAVDQEDLPALFGIVEIFYKSTLPSEYQFQVSDNSVNTKEYKIPFANRATKWRYIITRKFNPSITSVTVAKTNGSPINFNLLGGTPEGQFIAISDDLLPLLQEPVTGIKLTDQTNRVVISNLPNPHLNLIRTEGADTFSDILITI